MNEGSLRCNLNLPFTSPENLSARARDEEPELLPVRTEGAIKEEYRCQVEAVEKGEVIVQEHPTLRPDNGQDPQPMRRKETPTITAISPTRPLRPLHLRMRRSAWKSELPVLPDDRKGEVHGGLWLDGVCGGTAGITAQLILRRPVNSRAPKVLGNLMITEIFRFAAAGKRGDPDQSGAHGALADMGRGGRYQQRCSETRDCRPSGSRIRSRRMGRSPPDPLSRRAAGVWWVLLHRWFRLRVRAVSISLVVVTAADRAAATCEGE